MNGYNMMDILHTVVMAEMRLSEVQNKLFWKMKFLNSLLVTKVQRSNKQCFSDLEGVFSLRKNYSLYATEQKKVMYVYVITFCGGKCV